MTPTDYLLAALAASAAGAINAIAGGGTLISFPALLALGVPPIVANVTNTVALVPGFVGSAWSLRRDLVGQRRRIIWLLPAATIGGLLGGILLLATSERVFSQMIPFLIVGAVILLALGDRVKRHVVARIPSDRMGREALIVPALAILFAAIYGGYFGGGLGIIILAVLGAVVADSLKRINALKQTISCTANAAAAVLFMFSGDVLWVLAAVMAVGAVIGGVAGGHIAGRLTSRWLQRAVLAVGILAAIAYLVR